MVALPKIRIYDNQFIHTEPGSFSAGDLRIPPTFFRWSWVNDFTDYDVAFITENSFNKIDDVKERIKVALILEPRCINPQSYQWISDEQNYAKFDYILTHDKTLIKQGLKFVWYPFGGCWIKKEERRIYPKTKKVSIIASGKRDAEGHILRHEVIQKLSEQYSVDVYGRGYKPVENKLEALQDYEFSIVIENERQPGWFTEKINDCLSTGTIPIYWGDPTINEHYDMSGIVPFSNIQDLQSLLIHIDSGMLVYGNRIDAIRINLAECSKYAIAEDWIWENFLKKIIKL